MTKTIRTKKQKGTSATTVILTVVLLAVVVAIISAVNIKSIKHWSKQNRNIMLSQEEVAECCAQCAMCLKVDKSKCTCEVNGKSYLCSKGCGKGEWGGLGESGGLGASGGKDQEGGSNNINDIIGGGKGEKENVFLPLRVINDQQPDKTKCKLLDPYSEAKASKKQCVDNILKDEGLIKDIEEVSKYLNDKFKEDKEKKGDEECLKEYNVDGFCLLTSIMSVESCGNRNVDWYHSNNLVKPSYGIMQINVRTYQKLVKDHEKELKEKFGNNIDLNDMVENLKNVKFSVYLAALLLSDNIRYVNKEICEYYFDYDRLGFNSREDEIVAFHGAVYNGGSMTLDKSRDCSPDNCDNIYFNVPIVLCAHKPGGYIETLNYIPALLEAYNYCKEKRKK